MGGNIPDGNGINYDDAYRRLEQQRHLQKLRQGLEDASWFFRFTVPTPLFNCGTNIFLDYLENISPPPVDNETNRDVANIKSSVSKSFYRAVSETLNDPDVIRMLSAEDGSKSSNKSRRTGKGSFISYFNDFVERYSAGNTDYCLPDRKGIPWHGVKPTKQMNKAAKEAERIAASRGTVGSCYASAADAIDASYGKFLTGNSAYEAIHQLRARPEFKEYVLFQRDTDMLKHLPQGAIVVWERSSEHPHGHISIALGDGREASDHIQQQITNYGTIPHVFIPKNALA